MRKILIAILAICILLPVGYTARRGYRVWKQERAIRLAKDFLKKGDPNNAILCIKQCLAMNPANLEATRLIADFSEAARSPAAIQWRDRLVRMEPHSLTNRLLLARTALGFSDLATAQKALDGADPEGKKTVMFHKTASAVALAGSKLDDAEAHLQAAAKLETTNLVTQMNLAVLRLHRSDSNIVAESRATLERLANVPEIRSDVLRQLASDALRTSQPDRAIGFVTPLMAGTNVAFGDRLLQLEALRIGKKPQLNATLASLQTNAATHPGKVQELSKWMLSHTTPQATAAWLLSLPPNIRTNPPVPIIQAECLMAAKDWAGTAAFLERLDWGEMECLRLAYRARAFRSQNLEAAAKGEFAKALKASENRPEKLSVLLNLTGAWNWPAEREDVLWAIVNRYPAEAGAAQALSGLLFTGGKTRSLLTLLSQQASLAPDDVARKNNLAAVALLLNATEKKPHDLALQVYEKGKTNAFYASTYAFSLYLQQKPAEALKVLSQFKPEQLEEPGVAGYYALVLAATGDTSKAQHYFELAEKAKLLPEEAALFRKASAPR